GCRVDERARLVDLAALDQDLAVGDVAGDARLARLARAGGLVARLERVAARRDRFLRGDLRLQRLRDRGAPLGALGPRLRGARCGRLDGEGHGDAIGYRLRLAFPGDRERPLRARGALVGVEDAERNEQYEEDSQEPARTGRAHGGPL